MKRCASMVGICSDNRSSKRVAGEPEDDCASKTLSQREAEQAAERVLDCLVSEPKSQRADRIRELHDLSLGRGARAKITGLWPFCRKAANDLLWTCGSILMNRAIYNLINRGQPGHSDASEMGAAIMAAQRLERLVQDVQSSLSSDGLSKGCVLRAHRRLRMRFQGDQRYLSEPNIQAVRKLDLKIAGFSAHQDLQSVKRYLMIRQQICFSLPLQILDVSHQHYRGEQAQRKVIDASVNGILADFPHLDVNTLATFFGEVRANCYLPKPKRSQLYLWGPPGTGKSLFAQRAACALGLPFVPLTLTRTDLAVTTGSAGSGYGCNFGRDQDESQIERNMVGPLPVALAESGVLNPLFFFDETADLMRDGSTRESLKKLLDPNTLTLRFEELGDFQVDISRATFIFAGNEPIKDLALATRLKQIQFGPLLQEHKRTVIENLIADQMSNHMGLGATKVAALRQAMKGHEATILATDARLRIPGVRTAIEVTKETINFVNLTLTDPLCRNLSVDDFIESSFAARQVAEEEPSQNRFLAC